MSRLISPPAWILNEKVIDFVFFTDNESKHVEKEDKSFERKSKYNFVRAEAYVMGKQVCAIEDTGFSNVDQIMDKLVTILPTEYSQCSCSVQVFTMLVFSSRLPMWIRT